MAQDGTMILKVALLGGAAYLAYRYFTTGSLLGTTAPSAPTGTTPTMPQTTGATVTVSSSPATQPANVSTVPKQTVQGTVAKTLPNTLYQNMVRAASAAGVTSGTADDWNWWLMRANSGVTAPDPVPVFSAVNPNWQRSDQMNAAAYWAVMGPALSAGSLSGLGYVPSSYRWITPKGGYGVRA